MSWYYSILNYGKKSIINLTLQLAFLTGLWATGPLNIVAIIGYKSVLITASIIYSGMVGRLIAFKQS